MYHIGYNEKNERNIQAWLEQSHRSSHPAAGHGDRQWVHEISDDDEAMAQISSVFQGGAKSQNTPPLDLSVFEKGPRQAESPLDLSVKTRKRCADSTDIEELQRRRGISQGGPVSSKRLCVTQVGEQRRISNYPHEVKPHSEGYMPQLPQHKLSVSKYQYLPATASPLIQSSQQHVSQKYQVVQGYSSPGGISPAGQARSGLAGQYHPSRGRHLEVSRSYDPSLVSSRSHSMTVSNRRPSDEMKLLQKSETTALQGFYEPSGKQTLTVSPSNPDFLQTKRATPVEQSVLIMQDQMPFQGSIKRTEPIHQRFHSNIESSPYQSIQGKQLVVNHDSRGIIQQQKQMLQQRKHSQQMLVEQRSPAGKEQHLYSQYLSQQVPVLQKNVDRERISMIESNNIGLLREPPHLESSTKHIPVPMIPDTVLPSSTNLPYQTHTVKNASELRVNQGVDRNKTYPQLSTYAGQEMRNTPPVDKALSMRPPYSKSDQMAYPSYGGSKIITRPQQSIRTSIQSNVVSPDSSHISNIAVKHDARHELQRPLVAHPSQSVIQRQTESRHIQERTSNLVGSAIPTRPSVQNLMYERRTIPSNNTQAPHYNIDHKDNRMANKDLSYTSRLQIQEPNAPKTRQLAFHTSRGREISLISNSPELLPVRMDTVESNVQHYDSNERRLSRQHRLSVSQQGPPNNAGNAFSESRNLDMSRRSSISSQSSRKSVGHDSELHEQSKTFNTRLEPVSSNKTQVAELKKTSSASNLYSDISNARIASEMILPMAQKLGLERSITKGTSGLHKEMKGLDFMSNLIAEELKKDTEPAQDRFKNRSLLDEIDRSATSTPIKMELKNETEIVDKAKDDVGDFKNPSTIKSEPASYTLPLQIAIPGSKSGTRGSVISSAQSEKAPKVWSRKHMILSQFKHDEDLKNTVNIDKNEKIPVETSQFATKKGSEKSQSETLSICPPSPKMPILSPQEKQRITPMVSPATGDPPNLDDNNSTGNNSNAQSQSEQTPVKEIKSLEQHLHKLISDAVKHQGSFDKEKVCETVYRLTSQPQPHKPFITRQLSTSKNIPVANVAPFVHGKFTSNDFKVSESGEASSSDKPETKAAEIGTVDEEKKSQGSEIIDDLERSTSLGKYSSFESPSQQDVVCNFVNIDNENRFKASDIDFENSNSSFSTQNFSLLLDDDSNDQGISAGFKQTTFQKQMFGKDLDNNKDDDSLGFLSNLPKVSTSPKQEARNVFGTFDEILSENRIASDGEEKYDSDEEEESLLSEFKVDSNAGYDGDDEGKKDRQLKGKNKQSNTRQKADKLVKKARLSKNLKNDGSKNAVKSRIQRKNLIQKGFVDFMPEVLPQRTRTGRTARTSLRSGKDLKVKVNERKRSLSQGIGKGKKSTSTERRSNSLGRAVDLKSKFKPDAEEEDKFAYFSDNNDLDVNNLWGNLKSVQSDKAKWRIKSLSPSSRQTTGKSKGGLMVKLSLRALQQAEDESTDEEYFQNYENKFKTFASDSETKRDSKKNSASKKKKGFHFKQKYIFQKKRRPKAKSRIPQTGLQPFVKAQQPDLDDLYSFHEEGSDLQSVPSGSQELDAASHIPVPVEVKRMTVNKDTGETLLHRAARMGYVEVTLYCLATGNVDVNARDNAGYTPLHECCVRGHRAVAIHLLKYGADVNCCSVDGIRPIHDAVENDRLEMVRLLVSYGADPTISTYAGRTPLKIARTERMKHLLLCYIADLNGYTPELDVEEKPWQFNSSSNTLDTPEEEGSAIFYDVPSDPEDELTDLCNLSTQPLFPTQRITADAGKRVEDYIFLEDILRGYKVSKKDFESLSVPSHMVKSLTKQAVMDSKKDSIFWEYFSTKSDQKGIKAIRCVDATQIIHKIENHIPVSSTHVSHRTKS